MSSADDTGRHSKQVPAAQPLLACVLESSLAAAKHASPAAALRRIGRPGGTMCLRRSHISLSLDRAVAASCAGGNSLLVGIGTDPGEDASYRQGGREAAIGHAVLLAGCCG
jgi:hypothetical protein